MAAAAVCPLDKKTQLATGIVAGNAVFCPEHLCCFNLDTGQNEVGCTSHQLTTFDVQQDGGEVNIFSPKDVFPCKSGPPCRVDQKDSRLIAITSGGSYEAKGLIDGLRENGYTGRIIINQDESVAIDRQQLYRSVQPLEKRQLSLADPEYYRNYNVQFKRDNKQYDLKYYDSPAEDNGWGYNLDRLESRNEFCQILKQSPKKRVVFYGLTPRVLQMASAALQKHPQKQIVVVQNQNVFQLTMTPQLKTFLLQKFKQRGGRVLRGVSLNQLKDDNTIIGLQHVAYYQPAIRLGQKYFERTVTEGGKVAVQFNGRAFCPFQHSTKQYEDSKYSQSMTWEDYERKMRRGTQRIFVGPEHSVLAAHTKNQVSFVVTRQQYSPNLCYQSGYTAALNMLGKDVIPNRLMNNSFRFFGMEVKVSGQTAGQVITLGDYRQGEFLDLHVVDGVVKGCASSKPFLKLHLLVYACLYFQTPLLAQEFTMVDEVTLEQRLLHKLARVKIPWQKHAYRRKEETDFFVWPPQKRKTINKRKTRVLRRMKLKEEKK